MDAVTVLAQAVETEKVAPGTVGFLIVAGIGVAFWFLMKSMSKQLRKINFKTPDKDQEKDEHPQP